MSNLRNRVQLIGHVGQAPEIKTFESGKLARFSVATNESYKSTTGEWKEETYWHNVVAWGPIAERIEKTLQKGSFVMLEGKLTHREYTNDKNEKRYITEVRISNFVLLDKKNGAETILSQTAVETEAANADDGLPF